ncbi:MAG: SPFH domain-containing protein [Patescibacteria group bacterium]
MNFDLQNIALIVMGIIGLLALIAIVREMLVYIGPTEVGLLTKNFGRKNRGENPIAFNGEAGYQAKLLMPGLRFVLWPIFRAKRCPWVQIPADEKGVVISQIGEPLPNGTRSGIYKPAFGQFTDLEAFINGGGQKGVQRPVLPPGTVLPLHPIAFLVVTGEKVFGIPTDPNLESRLEKTSVGCEAFGLRSSQLKVDTISSVRRQEDNAPVDCIGVVTALDGEPLGTGDLFSRLGGFSDIEALLHKGTGEPDKIDNKELVHAMMGNSNAKHNSYQDFQAFLDSKGKRGLQYDVLLPGAYLLNPILVSLEVIPMTVVKQGEVAVVTAYAGLPPKDESGEKFKHGWLVRPGCRGIWIEPLRTGKYALNSHCYSVEKVPTAIITLNWSDRVSTAHNFDEKLSPINVKSKEGFVFTLDLQVQIHIPDAEAPGVISRVGSVANLVGEVLQPVVGNYFRNKLQEKSAVKFIEERTTIQEEAKKYVEGELSKYGVQLVGIFVQDVTFPEDLVSVLKNREIANQQVKTEEQKKLAEDARAKTLAAKGTAEAQESLSSSLVGIQVAENRASARKKQGEGEAAYIESVGKAEGSRAEALGKGLKAQSEILGPESTLRLNVIQAMSEKGISPTPHILVIGGNSGTGNGTLDAVLASMLGTIQTTPTTSVATSTSQKSPVSTEPPQAEA